MCHRQLFYARSTLCGHLVFDGGDKNLYVDCNQPDCSHSSSHPPDCASTHGPCKCRKYYTQPERIERGNTDQECSNCIDARRRASQAS